MATATIPTTISADARVLAEDYGVERELDEILDEGRRTVAGLLGLEVMAEPPHDMGERCIVVTAIIDPAFDNDPSHVTWWSYRIDRFGIDTAMYFLVCFEASRAR